MGRSARTKIPREGPMRVEWPDKRPAKGPYGGFVPPDMDPHERIRQLRAMIGETKEPGRNRILEIQIAAIVAAGNKGKA